MITDATSATPGISAKLVVNSLSALFGIAGTWLMARRYAREPVRAIVYALISPLVLILGGIDRVRGFIAEKIKLNSDVPESEVGMVLGLGLLIMSFLLQLLALYLEAAGK